MNIAYLIRFKHVANLTTTHLSLVEKILSPKKDYDNFFRMHKCVLLYGRWAVGFQNKDSMSFIPYDPKLGMKQAFESCWRYFMYVGCGTRKKKYRVHFCTLTAV